MRIALLALTALLVASAAPALAQTTPATGVQLTISPLEGTIIQDDDTRVPYKGSATLPVSVKLGCLDIFQNLPTVAVEVAIEEAPAWLTVTPANLAFTAQDCSDPSGFAVKAGTVTLGLKPEAPGVIPQTFNVTATFEDSVARQPLTMAVEYYSSYDVVADATFPLQVTGGSASFNVTVTQRSNARSMVMFEEVKATPGSIAGLASVPYDNPPASKTFKVTYTAPPGPWTEAKVEFVNYGHYLLDIKTGPFLEPKPTTWTFTNANPDGAGTEQASPLGGWVLIVAVLGSALMASRKR